MVRTRRPRKGSTLNEKEDLADDDVARNAASWKMWLEDFEVELDERLHKLDVKVQEQIGSLDRILNVMLSKIPPHDVQQPPKRPEAESSYAEDNSLNCDLLSTAHKGHAGLVTSTACKPHAQSPPPTTSRPSRSRTRRTRALSECDDTQFARPKTRSSSQNISVPRTVTKYQTPATKGNRTMQHVTPKVDPYCPMPLKRYARQGEMAISLEGSPLMMTTSITEPNICLPLNNGQEVYSIMPSQGPCPSLPMLDTKTKEKLMLLRQNLDQILGEPRN